MSKQKWPRFENKPLINKSLRVALRKEGFGEMILCYLEALHQLTPDHKTWNTIGGGSLAIKKDKIKDILTKLEKPKGAWPKIKKKGIKWTRTNFINKSFQKH